MPNIPTKNLSELYFINKRLANLYGIADLEKWIQNEIAQRKYNHLSQDQAAKVSKMYIELAGSAIIPSPYIELAGQYQYFHSNSVMPWFNYTDRSININSNNSNNSDRNVDPEKKQSSMEECLFLALIMLFVMVIGAIACVSFVHLACEILNHASRIYHNEGMIQGFMLLAGIALSYGLAMLTLYQLAGGFLMAATTAAALANPAGWAAAIIMIGAVVITPVFNLFIREGIYSAFSMFDSNVLVATDNRFIGMSTSADVSNLDPDRVNFAILCLYDKLNTSEVRQRFTWFDYNSPEMDAALDQARKLRNCKITKTAINVSGNGDLKDFSLLKPLPVAYASSALPVASIVSNDNHISFVPSAPRL